MYALVYFTVCVCVCVCVCARARARARVCVCVCPVLCKDVPGVCSPLTPRDVDATYCGIRRDGETLEERPGHILVTYRIQLFRLDQESGKWQEFLVWESKLCTEFPFSASPI